MTQLALFPAEPWWQCCHGTPIIAGVKTNCPRCATDPLPNPGEKK